MQIINVIIVFSMDIFLETVLIQRKKRVGVGGMMEDGTLTMDGATSATSTLTFGTIKAERRTHST